MKKIFLLCLICPLVTIAFAQLKENVGIGVRLQLDSTRGYKIPVILSLIPDGAASRSGLQAGDFIIKVNDVSTKNMVLSDIVSMITGEEGTTVKINAERKGVMNNYSITRGKYKYSSSFYQPAVKDNNFCTALAKLMNDAGYSFRNTMDTISARDKNENYVSKIKIPGAESTGMRVSFGVSCEVDYGSFATSDEVNTTGTKIIEQIKACFPDYYYNIQADKSGSVSVSIGQTFTSGYESPILQLFTFYDKKEQKHKLQLRVNGGKATRYSSIKTKAEDSRFANSLQTLYKDISNDFSNVKGAKHENKGVFNSSVWYEISPVPDGAKSCGVTEGSMSMGAKNCSCGFYQGNSRDDAVKTFNALFEKMTASLGPEFVYSSDKSQWDMNLSNAEAVISFGIKKKQEYESNLPMIVLVFEKYENNLYGVRILFYKSGF